MPMLRCKKLYHCSAPPRCSLHFPGFTVLSVIPSPGQELPIHAFPLRPDLRNPFPLLAYIAKLAEADYSDLCRCAADRIFDTSRFAVAHLSLAALCHRIATLCQRIPTRTFRCFSGAMRLFNPHIASAASGCLASLFHSPLCSSTPVRFDAFTTTPVLILDSPCLGLDVLFFAIAILITQSTPTHVGTPILFAKAPHRYPFPLPSYALPSYAYAQNRTATA